MTKSTDKVGYKHPPKNTQFKPGQSGNPKPQNKPSNSKKEGEGSGQKKPEENLDDETANLKKNKDRWGRLPIKERDDLEVNLKRDVPDGFEEDMKDFLERVKEIK